MLFNIFTFFCIIFFYLKILLYICSVNVLKHSFFHFQKEPPDKKSGSPMPSLLEQTKR